MADLHQRSLGRGQKSSKIIINPLARWHQRVLMPAMEITYLPLTVHLMGLGAGDAG